MEKPNFEKPYLLVTGAAKFIREEVREGCPQYLLSYTHKHKRRDIWVVAQDWRAEDFPLLLDDGVRVSFVALEQDDSRAEREALVKTLNHVATMVPGEALEGLRRFYREARLEAA